MEKGFGNPELTGEARTLHHRQTNRRERAFRPCGCEKALYGERQIRVRPASMWNEALMKAGKELTRFTYIGGTRMIYDISQPVFGCEIYPGDSIPQKKQICSIESGDLYNLTDFSMCTHNGTHVDAPSHFLKDGKCIEEIDLIRFIGPAFVAEHEGLLSGKDAKEILNKAERASRDAVRRILIKGKAVISKEAAEVFAAAGVFLLGNESQSVGPVEAPMEVHLILLRAEAVLLEGIRLAAVPEGVYHLNCAPILLNGCEGAPCRAILTDITI